MFSGSGRIGGTVFRGQFETDPRLAADTAWIELLGERIELAAPPAVTETRAEPLPGQDRRHRTCHHPRAGHIPAAVTASLPHHQRSESCQHASQPTRLLSRACVAADQYPARPERLAA